MTKKFNGTIEDYKDLVIRLENKINVLQQLVDAQDHKYYNVYEMYTLIGPHNVPEENKARFSELYEDTTWHELVRELKKKLEVD